MQNLRSFLVLSTSLRILLFSAFRCLWSGSSRFRKGVNWRLVQHSRQDACMLIQFPLLFCSFNTLLLLQLLGYIVKDNTAADIRFLCRACVISIVRLAFIEQVSTSYDQSCRFHPNDLIFPHLDSRTNQYYLSQRNQF